MKTFDVMILSDFHMWEYLGLHRVFLNILRVKGQDPGRAASVFSELFQILQAKHPRENLYQAYFSCNGPTYKKEKGEWAVGERSFEKRFKESAAKITYNKRISQIVSII